MGQVVNLRFACRVPNVKLKLMILILFIGHADDLCEVLDDFSSLFSLSSLWITIHEDIDNRCFANILIAHKDDFGLFQLFALDFCGWFLNLTTSFFFLLVAFT